MNTLPEVPNLKTISDRLVLIFPEGTPHRGYLIREMAAKTVFVMFYCGAMVDLNRWIRPDQITKMNNTQAKKLTVNSREEWYRQSLVPGKMKDVPLRWYAANTREPIRDETLRSGLVATGAVILKKGLPTTSASPRYSLDTEFAQLFYGRIDKKLVEKIKRWQENHLSREAMTRITLLRRGISAAEETGHIMVRLPGGETRRMSPGPSSVLTKDVMEEFCKRFL